MAQYEIWNNLFLIPPNDGNHKVTACYTLPKDVRPWRIPRTCTSEGRA